MKTFFVILGLVASSMAFPTMSGASREVLENAATLAARHSRRQEIPNDALGVSKAQTNCGPTPCLNFDPEDQLVSVTGQYAYASPAADEIRGPCPGLNAAANHGYLPRSGIASIEETVSGLGAGRCCFSTYCSRRHNSY